MPAFPPAASPPAAGNGHSPAAAPVGEAGYTDIPHTGMRRAIARRLTESKSTVPHFYLAADCRVDDLLELRRTVHEQAPVKITLNDFVVKAVAGAFGDVPEANAVWTPDAIRRFSSVSIAVAVAVDGGLVTPVVRNVDQRSLSDISRTIADLADRARQGRLRQPELEGGSFAISNLGMYGTERFAAIINPPQAGILAVGAATRQPVVAEDGSLSAATVMSVTLSGDHRVWDGALAAQWLGALKRRLEHPLSILI
jgi:pyruvate dehydrogenase E2 component (dihydrolipoamide acetyltransferase)